ncbi:hypothetical protein M9H77_30361 [Catharanthus roseus]|uniref:Uncharacterized protein n=1 Tax=Catharanthus roseus TaxID=4058 RepID=A0ACB9ZZ30_CATRO|nr:hypothetical protein M9H77_30361 [Catharanthus roseus]
MRTAFEQLHVTQDIRGAHLAKIMESTRRYADELAHQRASINRQEVILARLFSRFLPDQGNSRGGGAKFGSPGNDGLRPSSYRLCLSCQILL